MAGGKENAQSNRRETSSRGKKSGRKSSSHSDPLADQKKFDRFVSTEALLPVPSVIKPAQWVETVPYCLQVHKATGVMVPQALVDGLDNPTVEHLFQLSYYHVDSGTFFGKTWSSPPVFPSGLNDKRTEGGRENIVQHVPFGQRVYYHSTINDPSVVVVLELVAIAKVNGVVERELGVGWTVLRVFNKVEGRRPDSSDRALEQMAKKTQCEIYGGSPRGLVFLEESLERSMHRVPGCTLIYTLMTHEMMRDALPLIPENCFIGHQTLVPGIMRAKSVKDRLLTTLALPFVGYSDPDDVKAVVITPLAPPKLCPTVPMEVCETFVTLPRDFDDLVLRQMDFDRWQREDIKAPGDGRHCTIVSRRLHCGVHNGRGLISSPSVVVLKPGRTADGVDILEFDGIVNLGMVPKDAFCAVVMELEYTIEVPIAASSNPLVPKATTQDICVGYLAHLYYNPKAAKYSDGTFARAFVSGPGRSAMSNRLVFTGLDTDYTERLDSKLQINYTVVIGEEASSAARSSSSRGKRSIRSGKSMRQQSQRRKESSTATTTTTTTESSDEVAAQVSSSSSHRSDTPSAAESSSSESTKSYERERARTREEAAARRRSSKRDKSAQRRRVAELERMATTPQAPRSSTRGGVRKSSKKATPLDPTRHRLMDDFSPPGTAGGLSVYDDELHPTGDMTVMMSPRATHLAHGRISAAVGYEHHGQLSRATKAKLHRAGLQGAVSTSGAPVMDVGQLPDQARKNYGGIGMSGKPPEAKHDKLRLNEVTIQFLAFAGPSAEQSIQHKNLYFTFQFYVFPQISTERLNILSEAHEASNEPHVLVKPDGEGLQVKFSVDPAYMRRDEDLYFEDYLRRKALHVEVWDGDSMLQIGTVRVDMRGILRNGLEAIQMTEEYEILDTQMIFDSNAGHDITQQHANALRGRLHLRISNLGKQTAAPMPSATLHEIQFIRGDDDAGARGKRRKHKVKLAASQHPDLANLLQDRSRQLESTMGHGNDLNPDEERHLARVEALKKHKHVAPGGATDDAAVTLEMQRMERLRKLRTISAFRNKLKSDRIQNMLRSNISATKTIYPSYGQLIYFEFPLKNPYRQPQNFSIEVEDTTAELTLVTNPNEYNFYRQVFKHEGGPLDEQLFDHGHRIYTDALETVLIPFKYQSFQSGLVPYDPRVVHYPNVNPRARNNHIKNKSENDPIEARTIKIIMKNDNGDPVYILNIHVQPQPFITDQTLRFYQAENSFLKETIRIDNTTNSRLPLTGDGTYDEALVRRVGRAAHRSHSDRAHAVGEKYLVCSHDGVIATSVLDKEDESIQDIDIKFKVAHSPDVTRFYLVLYRDKYHASLFEIWEVFVYAQQRVDINAVVGEASKGSLVLRGGHSSRLVHTYSSSPQELRLEPEGSFSVVSGALNEITFQIQPFTEGKRKHRVHVVDEESKDLLAAWLVVTNARLPPVWKDYELQLPVRCTSNKKISYKNQYPTSRTFYLRTDRPNLLQFKEDVLDIPGQGTRYIGLKFLRYPTKAVKKVYVFINDQDEKNVDMMCIKLNYT